jgi:predicted nucleotidyltransferase
MFTEERRQQVREQLLERARTDERITGAALTGSAARDAEDRWSDVDLFFGVSGGGVTEVRDAWSAFVYEELGALHHFDLRSGDAVYRAFLLPELLEVDLGFTPAESFGPLGGEAFRVVFGSTAREPGSPPADTDHLIGLSWHHVLHARISLERGAHWQTEHWISAVRDHVLTLACLRLGLPSAYAKGADRLPAAVTRPLEETLVRSLDRPELARALRAVVAALVREPRTPDALARALLDLAEGA